MLAKWIVLPLHSFWVPEMILSPRCSNRLSLVLPVSLWVFISVSHPKFLSVDKLTTLYIALGVNTCVNLCLHAALQVIPNVPGTTLPPQPGVLIRDRKGLKNPGETQIQWKNM